VSGGEFASDDGPPPSLRFIMVEGVVEIGTIQSDEIDPKESKR
jgi:hypothetical protein